MRLKGKISVVIGGSGGIGFAIAQRFAHEGSHVFITRRRQKELDKAVSLIGEGVEAVAGDVTRAEDLDHLYETVKLRAGKLDILVSSPVSRKNFR